MIPSVIIEPQPRWVSFTPYWRNDRILNREFAVPIINDKLNDFLYQKIRNIVITYWAGWADYKEIGDFIARHPESSIFRMLNEYNVQSLSSYLLKVVDESKTTLIANFPRTKKRVKDYLYMNLNTLIYEERTIEPAPKKYDLIYYGMFRPNRAEYFKRYLNDGAYVSTSPKNILLFKQIGIRPRFIGTFLWGRRSLIENFYFSLYIEDIYTHTHYNFPANRFYEALMFNVVLLVDENCRNTFETAGYPVDDYYVSDERSLKKKIIELKKTYREHLRRQQTWREKAKEERKDVIDRLRPIFT